MSVIVALQPEPPSPLSEAGRLGEEIAELCAYLHLAKAHLLSLIQEFDAKRRWEQLGFSSCVQWLNFHCGLGPAAAREHLRVAVPPRREAPVSRCGRGDLSATICVVLLR